ncbi:efflux RND transporter permease subunit [Marininema halotolerans]|uniref:Hydrophobic/amphiphilic exporter-1, HAE1 family n=1 Tax=Marininema halotolerans TaxID=1155944 RepID=A0A1I6TSC7_9BACL|nr:efflux RND transporter permease subunit [Marininema halotolerans]SFS92112.1 hydrophobic/amphiphilic exporter-1, HAE1 family [Marininema halotolerans]
MSFLTRFSLRNVTAVIILALMVTMGGVYATTKYNEEAMPDISIPYLFVSDVNPGASPREMQTEVTLPLEKALKNVDGVKAIYSDSSANVSSLRLEFDFGEDMGELKSRVEEALSGVTLPPEAEKPKVNQITTDSQPIIYSAVTAKDGKTLADLQSLVNDRIVPTLKGVDGVGNVQVIGALPEDVVIEPNLTRLKEKKIPLAQFIQTLKGSNIDLPAGQLKDHGQEKPVQIKGRAASIDQLKKQVISPVGKVALQDVAKVTVGSGEIESLTRIQGKPSIAINVTKNNDANAVDVADKVKKEIADYTKHTDGISFNVIYDQSKEIKKSVNGMAREAGLGALFASLLILLFLRNIRATLIAIVTIPLSIFLALALLKYMVPELTLNIMTLGGIAIAVGRVIDDSIVVIENIVRRLQNEKVTKEIIADATKEVGIAIAASTLTTVAVFAPLGLVGGLIGQITTPFALMVVCSLLASLLIAVTVVPALAYLLMRRATPKTKKEMWVSNGYHKALKWTLNHKVITLILATLLFLGSLPLAGLNGFTFMPEQEEKYLILNLKMPHGTDFEQLKKEALQLDQALRKDKDVELSQVMIGSPKGELDVFSMSTEGAKANWLVKLHSDADTKACMKRLKKNVKPTDDRARFIVQDQESTSGAAAPIQITVTGQSDKSIAEATNQVTDAVKKVDGTDNVDNTLVSLMDGIDVQIRDEDALKYGLTTAQVSNFIRPYLAGEEVGKVGSKGDFQPIKLKLAAKDMNRIDDLKELEISTPMGRDIKLKAIADVKKVHYPAVLQLRNGEKYATISGDIVKENTGGVLLDIQAKLKDLDLAEDVDVSLGGSNDQINESFKDLGIAILLAIGLVYIVMMIAFGEGRAPFAILFSLPFAVTGALLGNYITGQPISSASFIGMLMLVGIVVTNAIVLVDRIQQQVRSGSTIREAILEAGRTRLRPVLITAITTICSLLPLAVGVGEGAIVSKGLAVVVIGGLITSTVLTLVIVPIVYELLHRKERKAEMKRA